MKKILITGSEGMLAKALKKSLTRYNVGLAEADVNSGTNPLDITKPENTSELISRLRPDIVIHTAAYTDVDGCEFHPNKAYLVNAKGTRNVAQACRDTKSFLVYISTDFIFNGNKAEAYKETDMPDPINIYGRSKLQGEEYIEELLREYLIIRTSWLFGKAGKNFVDSIVNKAKSGNPLEVVDDQRGSPTYSVHLADAITELLLSRCNLKFKLMNVTNTGSCTWYEFAREILKVKGIKDAALKPITSYQAMRAAKRPAMSALDNTRLIDVAGKPLPAWQDALAEYISKQQE